MSQMSQQEIDYFADLDRKERANALARGKQCNWQFDTEQEATEIAKVAWYLPDCQLVRYNNETWYVHCLANRDLLRVEKRGDKFCIVFPLSNFAKNRDKSKMADCNELGIPFVWE